MGKTLVILEVSRKQEYIFGSRLLKDNVQRSAQIAYATSSRFFAEKASCFYSEEKNLIYCGGGHSVLQFEDPQTAKEFARTVCKAALLEFDGMELFVKQMAYDPNLSPGGNLKELSGQLEAKKAVRTASFRQLSFGVEALNGVNFQPVPLEQKKEAKPLQILPNIAGWEYPLQFEGIAKESGFIAVVHIDGNGMGKRVNDIYEKYTDWDECCCALKRFSDGIQSDFEAAFMEMAEEIAEKLEDEKPLLPLRPLILAGDDVCYVTRGDIALETARIFLEKLNEKENCEQPGLPYAACAGAALVHTKYPFHQAYELSEELCSSAKKFGANLDESGRICAIDWHVEFGQLRNTLSELREEYETEDGNYMTLRPLAMIAPSDVEVPKEREYRYFCSTCRKLGRNISGIARSKLKEMRAIFRQGELESEFYLKGSGIYESFAEKGALYRDFARDEKSQGKRCLYFDAIELMDHIRFFTEEGVSL